MNSTDTGSEMYRYGFEAAQDDRSKGTYSAPIAELDGDEYTAGYLAAFAA